MARIVSVSYDETLLRTRERLLTNAGHEVVSCATCREAVTACSDCGLDLVLIGYTVRNEDKLVIIERFRRANADGVVVALGRAREPRVAEVDHYIVDADPHTLLANLTRILNSLVTRRHAGG